MSSTTKERNGFFRDKELQPNANGRANDEQLIKILDNALLKERRRKETLKPLFLTRYE
jgi:hypothetical protein